MIVDNGIITNKWVEAKPGELKVSSAEEVLKEL
jgi:peroxiredoxin